MAKLAVRIQEAVAPLLQPGEELKAVGQLQSGPLGPMASMMLLGSLLSLFVSKYWYAAITNQRLIVTPLNKWSKPVVERTCSIPLSEVKLDGKTIVAMLPNEAKPVKFKLYCGAKAITGLDGDGFLSALRGY